MDEKESGEGTERDKDDSVEDVEQKDDGDSTNDVENKEEMEDKPELSSAVVEADADEDKPIEVEDGETHEVVDKEEKTDESRQVETKPGIDDKDEEDCSVHTEGVAGESGDEKQEGEEERCESKEDDGDMKEEGEIDEDQKEDEQAEEPEPVVMEITSEPVVMEIMSEPAVMEIAPEPVVMEITPEPAIMEITPDVTAVTSDPPQEVGEEKEMVEDSQPGTSQSVGEQEVTISEGSTNSKADSLEELTLDEAKEKIVVLEKRLVREEMLRKTSEKLSAALVKQVEKLGQEVHDLRRAGKECQETRSMGSQTEPECIHIQDEQPGGGHQADVYQVGEGSRPRQQHQQGQPGTSGSTTNFNDWVARAHSDWTARGQSGQTSAGRGQSIADNLRATAEATLAHTGVVLDEASGMYYDYNSGYYYDPNNHLYYDPSRGIYYYYDEQAQSYQFHSKIDLPEVVVNSGANRGQGQPNGRRHDRDRRKGDRSQRRRNHDNQRDEQSGSNERPATSAANATTTGSEMDCEVIDITSPTEDFPENANDTTTTTTTSSRTGDKPSERTNGVDVYEIVDEEDSGRHRSRHRSRSSSSRRKRRKITSEEEKKGNGEELPDVIVLDSDDSDMEEGELSDSSSESRVSSKGYSEISESEDSKESMVIDDDDVHSVEATKVDYPPGIRMIVVRSESMKLGSLSVVTCTGGTIGREGSSHVLLVPELGVSKTHAQIAYDNEKKIYTITDLGSQNGTVLNGVPLTQQSRVKSDPQLLSHKDYLTFGTTTLRIHIHRGGETCDECEPGQVQALFRQQKSMEVTTLSTADKEHQRRRELRKIKKKYLLAGADYSQREPSRAQPGYKDRAEERRVTVGSDNPYQRDDMPSSVDRAISDSNMGHKMLKKMGWKEGESLGKGDTGIKEPIQVFLHGKKAGLGAGRQKSLDSMGLMGRRNSDVWDRARDRFYNVDQGGAGCSSRPSRAPPTAMKWVKGATHTDETPNPGSSRDGDDEAVEVVDDVVSVESTSKDGRRDANARTTGDKSDAVVEVQSSADNDDEAKENNVAEETMEEDQNGPNSPSDNSKPELSAENSVTTGIQKADDIKDDVSNETTSKSDASGSQVDDDDQNQLKSKVKTAAQLSPSADAHQSASSKQGTAEVPKEREAAKKPIKFVIPPRMNTRSEGGKNPLSASSSRNDPPGNSGDGATQARKTRQSSRKTKDKGDKVDMFENG